MKQLVILNEFSEETFCSVTIFLLKKEVSMSSDGDGKYGCAPIRDCYYAHVPSALVFLIKSIKVFFLKEQYPTACNAAINEIGCLNNFKVIEHIDLKYIICTNLYELDDITEDNSVTLVLSCL